MLVRPPSLLSASSAASDVYKRRSGVKRARACVCACMRTRACAFDLRCACVRACACASSHIDWEQDGLVRAIVHSCVCASLCMCACLCIYPVSYTYLRAHETPEQLVCRLLREKKKGRWTGIGGYDEPNHNNVYKQRYTITQVICCVYS